MNVRLQSLFAQAESLPEDRQEDLADLLESFMEDGEGDDLFTPEELAHLDRILAEPFVAADPEEIAALLGRRG